MLRFGNPITGANILPASTRVTSGVSSGPVNSGQGQLWGVAFEAIHRHQLLANGSTSDTLITSGWTGFPEAPRDKWTRSQSTHPQERDSWN